MLRTDAQIFAQVILVLKDVYIIKLSCAVSWLEQPSQSRDCRCLSRAVMPEQSKDLPGVHGHRGTIDRNFAVFEHFPQVADFERIRFPLNLRRNILEVLQAHNFLLVAWSTIVTFLLLLL